MLVDVPKELFGSPLAQLEEIKIILLSKLFINKPSVSILTEPEVLSRQN